MRSVARGGAAPPPWHLLLLLLVGACSCSLLQLAGAQDASKQQHVSGVDLSKATFNKTLLALPPDAYVLMEFFAT